MNPRGFGFVKTPGAEDDIRYQRCQERLRQVAELDNYRKRSARELELGADASVLNDRVTIDFEGSIDGQPFEGGKGEDIPVELGAGRMLADFEAGLRGVRAGENKEIELTFPANYPAANLAGPVKVLSDGGFREKYGALFMTPAETRAEFERLGWSRVAAFQTRNPMHRSHEYLAKVAIETCDGVLVHSLLGALKAGDIPAEVRTRAIGVLIEKYFRPGTVVQAGYPLDMRYAGPREALLHALFRQNYGCSHLVVGRDHAGVGSYYGPFDAHRIFDEIPRDALETHALKMDVTFWCYKCGGMASGRTCPHGAADQLQVSGTQLRKWLSEGATVPAEFSRPEVLQVLREYYAKA